MMDEEDRPQDMGFNSKITYPIYGWLEKEGHFMKSWNRRFFVLDSKSKTLTYYTDEKRTDKRGEVILSSNLGQVALENDHGDRKFLIRFTGIKKGVSTPTFLSCASQNDMKMWYEALSEVSFGNLISLPEIFPDPFRNSAKMKIVFKLADATNTPYAATLKRQSIMQPIATVNINK